GPGKLVACTVSASAMVAGVSGSVAAARPHCRRDLGRICRASRHGLCVTGWAATAAWYLLLSARRFVVCLVRALQGTCDRSYVSDLRARRCDRGGHGQW